MFLTRSTHITIYTLSLIFFPGVIIHELAHFFMANMLFVPTGEIEFFPQVQEGGVKLGSVAIAKTDPIRRFFIGVAPIFAGIGMIFLAAYYLHPFSLSLSWQTGVFFYLLFQIGNTMFSSKKDMEGAIGLGIFVAIIVLLFFLFGAKLPSPVIYACQQFLSLPFFSEQALFFAGAGALNVLLWTILSVIKR